jgi:hypothetical protein
VAPPLRHQLARLSGLSGGLMLAAFLCTLAWSPAALAAQSITTGEMHGRVVDPFGLPVDRARVVATSVTSGWERVFRTPRNGDFRFTQVPSGEYEVFVEVIGFGPVQVVGIPVRPGQITRVPATIAPAVPPVMHVDTVSLATGLIGIVTPGSGRWLQADAINVLPDRLRTISSLAALTSRFDESMGSEGLPGSMTQAFVNGVPFVPARHPSLPGGGTEALMLPRSGVAYMEFPETQTDIEWQGGAGGYAAIGTQSGGQRGLYDVSGSGSQDQLWSSDAFDAGVPHIKSFWGGARASVPLNSDTTRLFIAAEGYQVETPRLSGLTGSTASELPGLDGELASFGSPFVEKTQSVSGVARVDWTVSPTTSLEVGAMVAALEVSNSLGSGLPAPYGTTPPQQALDLLVSATLSRHLFAGTDLEFRASFQQSVRDFRGPGSDFIPGTRFVDSGSWIGLDPSLPSRVARTSLVGGPTLHLSFGRHSIKAGGLFSIPSFEYESPNRGVGSFAFASSDALATGAGSFSQLAEPRPAGSFSMPGFGSFIQYAWDPVPGLRLTGGFRWDAEILPDEDVIVNSDWFAASGMRADSLDSSLDKFSGRIGLHWKLTEQGRTVFVAGAGTHHGDLDPGAMSEVLSFQGGIDVRRSVGGLSGWPDLPNETAVPVTGERIALMSPEVQSPRTNRAYLGLWQLIGEGTVFRASGSFRRTDFLLRRTDLNLVNAASGSDQFGRPVFGQLIQQGGLLTSVVGSNRRFAGFDQVWALNPDGWSEQIAATFSIDHRATDWFELFGVYTWSETTDNWLGLTSGRYDAALDPGLDELGATPWSEGASDLDVTHRLAAGLSVRYSAVTLTGTYRFRSAYPFTAGYRAGVDANGDGSALNDVAFVLDDPAVLDLAQNWDCLSNVGGFATRNSCRGKGVHALDVRLSLALFRSRGARLELFVEGFNLLESADGLRDTALLLVDGTRQMSMDPNTGDLDVPVTVNPGFGEIIASTSVGRMLRIGFRLGGGAR